MKAVISFFRTGHLGARLISRPLLAACLVFLPVWQLSGQSVSVNYEWRSYGGELRCNTPAEFSAFIEADRAMWGRVIRQAKVKLD